MPTLAQEAFAEGFADLADVHGTSWTFGTASFTGVASALKPDDPRLIGSTDRLIEVIVLTASLPATAPKRGEELVRSGRYHRISRIDPDSASGYTSILVVA